METSYSWIGNMYIRIWRQVTAGLVIRIFEYGDKLHNKFKEHYFLIETMLYKILQIKDQFIYSYKLLKYIIVLSNLRLILKPCSKIKLLSNLS